MKKTIAICALSMAVQTALGDARPLVGFEAKPGFLIAAEQKSNSIVAIDAWQAGAPVWAWEWKASRDPGIDKGDVKFFNAPSDCKVNGNALLIIASCGNFAEVSLETGRAVCYGHIGGNPHSITRLPGKGMFATASSVSHSVTIVCTAENPFKPDLPLNRGVVFISRCLFNRALKDILYPMKIRRRQDYRVDGLDDRAACIKELCG